jgi:hypothetical protein
VSYGIMILTPFEADFVRVVVQDSGVGCLQQRRDRVVPATEPAAQPGQPATAAAFGALAVA